MSLRKFQLKVVGIALLVFRAYPVQSVKFVPLVEAQLVLFLLVRLRLANRNTQLVLHTLQILMESHRSRKRIREKVCDNIPTPGLLTRGWAR